MNTHNRQQTAQILQFPPPGARASFGGGAKAILKQKSDVFEARTVIGGAWYHEAAIAETDRFRKS